MPKFSELTAAGTLTGSEIVAVTQSSATVRSTATAIANTASAINGTVGAVTPAAGAFTTLAASGAVTFAGLVTNTSGAGTVTEALTTTAAEHGSGIDHLTVLTCTAFTVGTTADNAALGIGASLYTFPAGTILVDSTSMVGSLTATMDVTTDTPEVGLGTVIASGVVSVLSGTATFEDLLDGNASGTGGDTVAPDVAGTTFYKTSSFTAPICIKTSGGKSHTVFLNAADTWADVTTAGLLTFTGVITLKWRKIS
jgi:hypothetical protein